MKIVCQRFVGKKSKARSGQIISAQVDAIETTCKLEGFGSMIGIVWLDGLSESIESNESQRRIMKVTNRPGATDLLLPKLKKYLMQWIMRLFCLFIPIVGTSNKLKYYYLNCFYKTSTPLQY
jgi:hypothetical protein